MSYRIYTNVNALNAHTSGIVNNRNMAESLEKLSSGLRINKAGSNDIVFDRKFYGYTVRGVIDL